MNLDFDNKYTRAIRGLLFDIGFSEDRVLAVNITNGFIEVALKDLPHADPALISNTTITINYTKESR